MLEKEISGLKKEIRERDETIGDKEKRIYDLKKKNQELEKFKFVLDYKIKELKKQIEPRELEIADMKQQIKEMDHELERYHKSNASLELTISDNKLRLEGQQLQILSQRHKFLEVENYLKRYRDDVHAVIQYITEPKQLKEAVKVLYQKHVVEPPRGLQVDQDIQKEYNRQRIMQENVILIKEINELRREVKSLRQGGHPAATRKGSGTGKRTPLSGDDVKGYLSKDLHKEIDMQREEIQRLRLRVDELQGIASNRPISREKLPPMEGYVDGGAFAAVDDTTC
jgi:cilia- and flagella-associated protein 57